MHVIHDIREETLPLSIHIVLILDGNSGHGAGKGTFLKKRFNLRLLSVKTNASKRSNYRSYSLGAHLFLCYHLIKVLGDQEVTASIY